MDLFNSNRIEELEQRIKDLESKIDKQDRECGEDNCALRESEFQESGERKNIWVDWLLHQKQTLEHLRTGDNDRGDRNKSCNLCPDSTPS